MNPNATLAIEPRIFDINHPPQPVDIELIEMALVGSTLQVYVNTPFVPLEGDKISIRFEGATILGMIHSIVTPQSDGGNNKTLHIASPTLFMKLKPTKTEGDPE